MIKFSFGTMYTVQLQNIEGTILKYMYIVCDTKLFFIPVFVVRTLDITTGFDVIF